MALGMSVRQAQRTISAREFAEWQAYARLQPWGEERADLRMGILASTVANVWRGKDTPTFSYQDFMPQFGEDAQGQDDDADIEATQALFASVTATMGGRITEE